MSSDPIVEHVILFNIKDDTDPSKIDALVSSMNGLRSLDPVAHLTAGRIHRIRSPPPLRFTLLLHSRYRSREDLIRYDEHPHHARVKESVSPFCEDVLAVDWLAGGPAAAAAPSRGSAMRVTFLKVREGLGEAEKGRLVEALGGVEGADLVSVGENFSPARAKGFSIASMAVFPGLEELERSVEPPEEKVRDLVESVMVVDFVVPSA